MGVQPADFRRVLYAAAHTSEILLPGVGSPAAIAPGQIQQNSIGMRPR